MMSEDHIELCMIIYILQVLAVTVKVIQKVADEKKANFLPRPYFRLFVMWLMEFSAPDPLLDASNFQVMCMFF